MTRQQRQTFRGIWAVLKKVRGGGSTVLPQAELRKEAAEMTGKLNLAQIEEEISEVRANLRELVEQETARSGAQDENRGDDLIAAQEAKLARLLKERDALIA
jgi:hypothetical protein